MKKNHLLFSKMCKRGISIFAAGAISLSAIPAFSIPVSAANTDLPDLLKAGSVPVSEDTLTQEQPFATGTGGSRSFRIPAIITLENGDLVAAADARYETNGDGGGLDTIASVSSDGGNTWNYSYPLYFPDSKGYAGRSATTIIDPGIVEGPDGTVYCFADVNPTGSTTMYKTIGTGTGYVTVNGGRYLAITDKYSNVETRPTDADLTTYEYYVDDFDEDGYAQILKRADGSATGYGVDEWYNLYTVTNGEYVADLTQKQVNSNTDIQQNVFYKDSLFHVYSIGYIWYVTSKDHGRTWEHPRNINDQVKRQDNENAILVSPGQGITTNSGDIVLGFYDHGGEENASIVYSTDNGATWKRTNDVPGAGAGGRWSSENEIVELEDGTLRMFYRSGAGVICYCDAQKNANGEYVMGTSTATGVSVCSTCNVSAISYSKKINGKQAVMVACPGGPSARNNGKIFTFLVEEDNSLSLFSTFSVPNSEAGYSYSCLTELEDGTLGLLWEPNTATQTIRYDRFSLPEVAQGASVEGTSLNVEVAEGEDYRRDTNGAGVVSVRPDESIATISTSAETKEEISLHDHVSNTASNLKSFSAAANKNISLSDAEFTFQASGDNWKIYNEKKGVYLTNATYASTFFSNTAADMKVTPTNGQNTFRICKSDGNRYVIFYFTNMDFNSNSGYNAGYADGSYELVLLEKQENSSDGDVIPGYKRVSSVTDGKKYLISYIWTDGSVMVLYPENGTGNQTKRVGSLTENRKMTVTIHGVSTGYTKAMIDGIQYRIRVTSDTVNGENILKVGENFDVKDAAAYTNAPADENVIKVQAYDEKKQKMYDHVSNRESSLESFSDTENTEITLSEAEFTITASGENWKIYNEAKKNYLVNADISNFFQGESSDMKITPVSGKNAFRISRADGKRYVIFYFKEMNFNASSDYNANYADGSYELMLLEKQDAVSGEDVIPGYKRVSTITSGKKYLISYIWTDGSVMVLYPENGKDNQSKLAFLQETGIRVTAMGKGTASVSIDGTEYRFKVADPSCTHQNKTVKGAVPADCDMEGYTGDEVCNNCGIMVKEGTVIPMLTHDWDEGVVTKEVTRTENGEKVYTCKNDSFHKKTEIIYASALDKLMTEYERAAELMTQTEDYTAEEIAEVKAVYDNQTPVVADKGASRSTMYAGMEALKTAVEKAEIKKADREAQEQVRERLAKAISSVEEAYAKGESNYTADTWNVFEKAYNDVKNALENEAVTEADAEILIAALQDAKDALVEKEPVVKPDEKLEEAKKNLTSSLEAAKGLYAAGKSDYTAETWNAFALAYSAAVNAPANADAAFLKKLADDLNAAKAALKKEQTPEPVPVEKFEKGAEKVVSSGRYQVLNEKNKTAKLVEVVNKNATKLNVPATVKIGGVSCKVVEVGNKAFRNGKKLSKVILGKNVTTIGKQAFMNCKKLKTVQVKGKALKKIKAGAFKNTSAKITVSAKKMSKKQKAALLKNLKKSGISKKAKVK